MNFSKLPNPNNCVITLNESSKEANFYLSVTVHDKLKPLTASIKTVELILLIKLQLKFHSLGMWAPQCTLGLQSINLPSPLLPHSVQQQLDEQEAVSRPELLADLESPRNDYHYAFTTMFVLCPSKPLHRVEAKAFTLFFSVK